MTGSGKKKAETRVALIALAIAGALGSTDARAQEVDAQSGPVTAGPRVNPIVWDVPRVSTGEWALTFASALAAVGSQVIPTNQTRWVQPTSFDKNARSALMWKTHQARLAAADVSDVFLATEVDLLFTDSLFVTWYLHDSGDAAFQMAVVDAEVVALTIGVDGLIAGFTSRERPYHGECDAEHLDTQDCRDNTRYRSFFSGHTSTTFAAASVTCMHHAHFGLYGSTAADALACAGAYAMATATGYLRVAADKHYMTDVLTGAGYGTLVGLGIPYLFHYRSGLVIQDKKHQTSIEFLPGPLGASIAGVF